MKTHFKNSLLAVFFSLTAMCGNLTAENDQTWFLDVDFLYWQAAQQNLMYASIDRPDLTISGFSDSEIKKKNPHTRYDSGIRLGIGHRFDCSCYDAMFYWTNYNTSATSRYDVGIGETIIPAYGNFFAALPPTTTIVIDSVSAHWNLNFNLFDLEIGRSFAVNSCLAVRPFIGVRGAEIHERYRIRYVSVPLSPAVLPSSTVVLKEKFEGAGIRIGSDVEYEIGCGFKLFGDIAGSLLYGEQKLRSSDISVGTTGGVDFSTTIAEFQKDHESGFRAITDLAIGVRWQHVCCEKEIQLEIGYEQHYFFNESQFEKFTNLNGAQSLVAGTDRNPQRAAGGMSVQGLVVSAKLDF